jgi:hypothetical protein
VKPPLIGRTNSSQQGAADAGRGGGGSNAPLGVSNDPLEVSNVPLEGSNALLEVSSGPLEVSNEPSDVSNTPLEAPTGALELSNAPRCQVAILTVALPGTHRETPPERAGAQVRPASCFLWDVGARWKPDPAMVRLRKSSIDLRSFSSPISRR